MKFQGKTPIPLFLSMTLLATLCLAATDRSSVQGSPAEVVEPPGLVQKGGPISLLTADPVNGAVLYVATPFGLLKSTDAGSNWTSANKGLSRGEILCLAVDPSDTNILYCGTPRGMYTSSNGGNSWALLKNCLSEVAITSLAIDPHDTSTLYAIARNAGWLMAVYVDNSKESYLKSTTRDCVFASSDRGMTWSSINAFADPYNVQLKLEAIAVDPFDPRTLFAGTSSGLYKSTDRGASWPYTYKALPDFSIKQVVFAPADRGTVYAGTTIGVFKSTDNGASWSALKNGLPATEILALVLGPNHSRTLFAGTAAGIYTSTDGGTQWVPIHDGPGELAVNCLLLTDKQNDNSLYIGTGEGLLIRSNGRSSWAYIVEK